MSPVRWIAAACVSVLAIGGTVAAFHDGGVGNCKGCHVSHDGQVPVPGDALLKGANSTDTCLLCHQTANGNTWGRQPLDPGPQFGGGSFVFLLEDNLNDGPDGDLGENWIGGDHAGHNVISPGQGIGPDLENPTAPGGTYPSSSLTCTSCHDPHGRNGHYRLLYGGNYDDSRSDGYVFHFGVPAPTAEGISLFGAGESSGQHVAYRSGWADWCGACHGRYHDQGVTIGFEHPVDRGLGAEERQQYDVYDGTGFWNTGSPATSYIPEVTYEDGSVTSTYGGPVPAGARITCMTCHRAHASSAPYAGRWDFNIETWASEGAVSGSYPLPNPYAGTAGPSQGQLCEKCHGQTLPE